MKDAIQYLANEDGQRTAVVVPYAEWEKLQQQVSRLRQKVRVLQGIRQGVREVQAARQHGQPLQTLSAFLDDC